MSSGRLSGVLTGVEELTYLRFDHSQGLMSVLMSESNVFSSVEIGL